jgi:hypothetical protein
VFILHGDILRLACDAIALSRRAWMVNAPWLAEVSEEVQAALRDNRPTPSSVKGGTVFNLTQAFETQLPPSVPTIFIMAANRLFSRNWADFVAGIEEFIAEAVRYLIEEKKQKPKFGRAKHLIALPAFGVRFTGVKNHAGAIVKNILDRLFQAVVRYPNVDFALISNDQVVFHAALAYRRGMHPGIPFHALSKPLRAKVDSHLVGAAQRGELALFIGAGCSVGAGLPQWGQLLNEIAISAGLSQTEINNHLGKLNHLDQARILEKRLGGSEQLTKAITTRLRSHFVSATHVILQSLPCEEVITTNYDTLYEQACRNVQKECSVLPYQDNRQKPGKGEPQRERRERRRGEGGRGGEREREGAKEREESGGGGREGF